MCWWPTLHGVRSAARYTLPTQQAQVVYGLLSSVPSEVTIPNIQVTHWHITYTGSAHQPFSDFIHAFSVGILFVCLWWFVCCCFKSYQHTMSYPDGGWWYIRWLSREHVYHGWFVFLFSIAPCPILIMSNARPYKGKNHFQVTGLMQSGFEPNNLWKQESDAQLIPPSNLDWGCYAPWPNHGTLWAYGGFI